VLVTSPGAPDPSALDAAARAAGVPLHTLSIPDSGVATAYDAPLVLVRPDGHVAWRGERIPPDAAGLVDTIRGADPVALNRSRRAI